MREIYDCLMFSQCQIQYAKYGNYIPLENVALEFDLRIAQQFVFYIIFSMLSGALASNNMSNGISFSRAVGIIFLLNEVDQIVYYQSQMDWRVT